MRLLKDITTIRAGYQFRGGVEPSPEGQYRVVQIKDISADGELSIGELVRTELDDVRGEHLLREGDLLFISRGPRKQAAVVGEDLSNVIAGAQFFIIKTGPGVLPEFLAWYINQTPAQRYLTENAVGSNVRIVTRAVLEHLSVEVPPVEDQQKIVKIHQLSLREKMLLETIKERRGWLIESALLKIVQSKSNSQRSAR